jgi:hypothetical protein
MSSRGLSVLSAVVLVCCNPFGSSSSSSGEVPDVPQTDGLTGTPCNSRLDCTRILFVTSDKYQGDLGGVPGGNGKCMDAARKSPFPRVNKASFNAWLALSGGAGPTSNVIVGTKPYVSPSGKTVAPDLSTLAATGFSHVPSDEAGVEIGGPAWTGVDTLGQTCGDWRDPTTQRFGGSGQIEGGGEHWQTDNVVSCDQQAHLYCLEN